MNESNRPGHIKADQTHECHRRWQNRVAGPCSDLARRHSFETPGCVLQVSFEIADIMTCELRPNSFDVIYSRDTILHIKDKAALFHRCFG